QPPRIDLGHAPREPRGYDDRLRHGVLASPRRAALDARTAPRPAVLRLGAAVHPGLPAARDPVRVPAPPLRARSTTGGRRARVIHIGTSGWQYRDWGGTFYPDDLAQREWLPYYATRFRTVEVNNSFYRLPEEATFKRWKESTPAGFVMAVKASRFLTHLKRLRDPEEPVDLFWERATNLGPRLGPVLFQLPPRFPADRGRLGGLLHVLPRAMRAAFEFRDPSWHTTGTF